MRAETRAGAPLRRAILILSLAALGLLGALLGAWIARRPRPAPPPRLTVVFLDVGRGDCALIRTPGGRTLLLDAGSAAAGPVVADTLRRLRVHTVDLLILASPSEDSIGGVPAVLASNVTVAQAWDGAVAGTTAARRAALTALAGRRVPLRTVSAGDKIQIGDRALLSVLWPPEQGPRARLDPLVCRLDYGETAFLFDGPCDGEAERYLVAGAGTRLGGGGDVVLQAAAHGADGGTSAELLRRAAPTFAVIAADPSRPPGARALHRLRAAGAEVWRTDQRGAITVYADGRTAPVLRAAH